MVYREAGKHQMAIETFHKMLELAPPDDNAIRGYQQMVETYRDNKQWQLATNAAEEAAKNIRRTAACSWLQRRSKRIWASLTRRLLR